MPLHAASLDPSSPELARPAIDPEADAEVVQYDIRIVDGVIAQGFDRLIEIRRAVMIYTSRGAVAEGVVSIPMGPGTEVEFTSVRVTTPDGGKRTVTPSAMIDQDIVRAGRLSLRRRTCVVPGLVPGSLVEVYARIHSLDHRYVQDMVFPCQDDIPIRWLRLRVRPWKDMSFVLHTNAALQPAGPISTDDGGYRTIVLRDVPAWHAEAWMPEFFVACPAVWGEYTSGSRMPSLVFRLIGRSGGERTLRSALPVSDSLASTVAEILGDAGTPADRAGRLFRYCRTSLRNLSATPDSAPSGGKFDDAVDDMRPWTTIRNGASNRTGINLAFAGLAIASGLDVRLVLTVDDLHRWFGLPDAAENVSRIVVATSGPGGWRFFDPGDPYLPPGFVDPTFEGSTVFLTDGTEPVRFTLPRMPASLSREERVAELQLSPEGDADGTLKVRWTGHVIGKWQDRLGEMDAEERKREVLDGLMQRWRAAQVDSFAFSTSEEGPALTGWTCRVRIPAYAPSAGDVQLAPLDPFEALHVEVLSDTIRRHPIRWLYSWTESDRTVITVPAEARVTLPTVPRDAEVPGVFHAWCAVRADGERVVTFERTAEYTCPPEGLHGLERWSELRASVGTSIGYGRLVAELSPGALPAGPPK